MSDQCVPVHFEHNWYSVTTWAARDWDDAKQRYFRDRFEYRHDPRKLEEVDSWLAVSRMHYRDRVLSWYRKLLLPMQPGDCVPDEVALLIAEEWDEATK